MKVIILERGTIAYKMACSSYMMDEELYAVASRNVLMASDGAIDLVYVATPSIANIPRI